MITDDSYLFKLKNSKMTDEAIAKKLGVTMEEVKRRWDRIVAEVSRNEHNGYNALCDAFTVMANQYQLLGSSLRTVAGVIGSVVTSEELEKLIKDPVERDYIKKNHIVLRRFVPPPLEMLDDVHRKN